MEWMQIEEKWHDIARRLQLTSPGSGPPAPRAEDADTGSGPSVQTGPLLPGTDDLSARAAI